MKKILLTRGKTALVDDADYEWLNQWKWHYNTRGYAKRTQTKPVRREIAMHRIITDAPEGMDVDHINGNKLDNRRENLRVVTHKANCRNQRRYSNSKKRFKGVFIDSRCSVRKFFAQIVVDGKKHTIGYFATEEEAAAAYNKAASKFFGEYAQLNDVK